MSVDLIAAASAIPEAKAGNIITSEHHNSLLGVVREVVKRLGAAGVSTTVITQTPVFSTNTNAASWQQLNGIATAVDPNKTTGGFIPLRLPDAGHIRGLKVMGKLKPKAGQAIGGFIVKLVRQAVSTTAVTTLIAVPLEDVLADAKFEFTAEGSIDRIPGLGPAALAAAIDDFSTVDNTKFKYLLIAEADQPYEIAQLYCMQVAVSD